MKKLKLITGINIMKYKAIIVSDVHLGTENCKASEFMDFLDEHKTDLLIINGDFIDGWALYRGSKWTKKHTKVLYKILKISKKSNVVWIRGNHDEFLNDFLDMHLGKIQISENYVLNLNNQSRYFVFHGDVLDVFIVKWKWIARLGAVGYELALNLNTVYNKFRKLLRLPYYSISKDIKNRVKRAVNYITDFEVSAAKLASQRGCTGVICGHIHKPENTQISGIHYLNSGDWVENLTAILIDHDDRITVKEYSKYV